MEGEKTRCKEPWVDIVKWAACMLVLLGHFFQSMEKSGIMQITEGYKWFEHTIYLFHVPLFFFCSGYLYQRNSVVTTKKEWKNNIFRKLVNLGVPYVSFSTISFLMKEIFSNSVNDENSSSLLKMLLLEPLSPYWYLYILFFLFLFTWTFKDKKQIYIMFFFSVCIYFFHQNPVIKEVYFIGGVAHREIWFIIGMILGFYHNKINFNVRYWGISFLLFPLSIMGYNKEMVIYAWIPYSLATGICGCLLIFETALFLNRRISEKYVLFSRKNTLPVFLMHTIFAAGIRSALCRIGITNLAVHMILGIAGSIFLPVAATEIMRKFRWMYFFINPGFERKGSAERTKI
jgi:Fucose 4-O-acetylase and related acetyltransferases